MSDVKAAIERMAELAESKRPDGEWLWPGQVADLRLVLSRLQALERECKAWREWWETTAIGPSQDRLYVSDEVVSARAATDATERETT